MRDWIPPALRELPDLLADIFIPIMVIINIKNL